jgi:hypothetical protein
MQYNNPSTVFPSYTVQQPTNSFMKHSNVPTVFPSNVNLTFPVTGGEADDVRVVVMDKVLPAFDEAENEADVEATKSDWEACITK